MPVQRSRGGWGSKDLANQNVSHSIFGKRKIKEEGKV